MTTPDILTTPNPLMPPQDLTLKLMNQVSPSFFQLPQDCSPDRKRARRATLAEAKLDFALVQDPLDDGLPLLPAHIAKLPSAVNFPLPRLLSFAAGKVRMKFNAQVVSFGTDANRYRRLYQLMQGPKEAMTRWRDDLEFARQRLSGVNPMMLRRCDEMPERAMLEAADTVLATWPRSPRFADLQRAGRTFLTDYAVLLDPGVQQYKKADPRAHLTGPLVLYALDELDRLRPLAIQVRSADGRAPIATATGDQGRWLVARGHAQAADAQIHEAYYHLWETHLVSETLAVCLYRNLYPEHPVRQLLEQHYEFNLAIDSIARSDLLSVGGPIDITMAGGVNGAFAAARVMSRTFDMTERTLERDLELRGMLEIPDYPYREDALRVRPAIRRYVEGVMSPWYTCAQNVLEDTELRAFLQEVAGPGGIPSCPQLAAGVGQGQDGVRGALPKRIETPTQLFDVLTDFIFRAAPQHAAVNNGQYDAYGYIPNTPGTFGTALSDDPSLPESAYWDGLPAVNPSMAQLGMVWVLSMPTVRSLLHTGDCPAFQPEVCRGAAEAVAAFRRRLHELSDAIDKRNESREIPYRYLDPRNISRSTDI